MTRALDVLGVDNVMLAVGDLAEARLFYVDGLGLEVRFEVPEAGIILLRLGPEEPGLVLRVQGLETGPPRPTPRLWLEVADARAAAIELRRRGLHPLAEPFPVHTGWTVEVADPWGNVIGLTDYVSAPERARAHAR